MIKIAIVEDDESYSSLLKKYILEHGKKNNFSFEIDVFNNALSFLDDYKGDYSVVFMDIQMPYMDGMTAANKLRELDTRVLLVFVTNLSNYAIEGYSVNAIDYILKPIDEISFSLKFSRVLARIEKKEKESISVQTEKGTLKLSVQDILYIEVMNHQVIIHSTKGNFKQYTSLSKLEEQLKDTSICRCNSFLLVNLYYVSQKKKDEITLTYNKNDFYLPVSRSNAKTFFSKLKAYLE